MSNIDLHIHSSCSDDGEFAPADIVARCKEKGMKLAAITDHNSARAVDEALAAAGELRVLSGVELDCSYKGRNFHLLGYHFDHTREEFAAIEQDILEQERNASEEKIRLFQKATGILFDPQEVLRASENGVVAGEMIGEYLLAKESAKENALLRPYLPGGEKSDMPHVRFYWDFFSEGKAAYVPIRYLSLHDAVALIHSAGGIAVLAHPGQNLGGDDSGLLNGIIAEGIDGIEAFSSYHCRTSAAYYLEIAERNRLLVTCGSDFHGKHKPQIELGGHGALWEDQKIIAGIEERIGKI